MKNKSGSKIKIWVTTGFASIFLILMALSFSGTFDFTKVSSSAIGFLAEGAHTGLDRAPATQMAFDNYAQKDSQFAQNNQQNNIQGAQAESGEALAMGQIPRVLFDISAQPIFQKQNSTGIILILVSLAVICFALIYYMRKNYIKRKLQRIKKNTRGN